MSYRFNIISLLLCLLLSSSVFSQSKVGTVGSQELLLSPSVSSNGMGETGVAVIDNKTYYFNPGNLGLLAMENKISLSMYPGANDLMGYDFNNYSVSSTIKKIDRDDSPFSIGFAFYYSKLSFFFEEFTYDYPEGTGNVYEIAMKNYNFVLAGGYSGVIDVGFGLNFKTIRENIFEVEFKGNAFDFGAVARKVLNYPFNAPNDLNWIFIPTAGLSYSNSGGDIETDGLGFVDTTRPTGVLDTYELPTITRYGVSLETGIEKNTSLTGSQKIATLLLSYENEDVRDSYDCTKFGAQLNLYDFIMLRYGKIFNDVDTKTHGLTLSSMGLLKIIFGSHINRGDSFKNFIVNNLDFKYSYAKQKLENSYFPDTKYHEISLDIYFP